MRTAGMVKAWFPAFAFLLAFICVPLWHLQGLASMPGDIGDARLNNYFLENIYLYLIGRSDSLWHLGFFYPYPYVLGFSDNLFGASPLYVAARFLSVPSDTAFQIWFLAGYAANFSAAYYALRRLEATAFAATIGAVIFAFALPTTAHVGHAQLHFRFGIPLTLVFLTEFLLEAKWRALLAAGFWLIWQFYAGIYMGFFALLLSVSLLIAWTGYQLWNHRFALQPFVASWRAETRRGRFAICLALTALVAALVWLFFPYIRVSEIYGANRGWSEIESMLPRPWSYLINDSSYIWPLRNSALFNGIPMRHEHQMFIGLVPLALAVMGVAAGLRHGKKPVFVLMAGTLAVAMLLSLDLFGLSLWYFISKLPLGSAIRAVARLDQALLFPAAYLAALAVDDLLMRKTRAPIMAAVLSLLIFESSMTAMSTSPKSEWRQRIADLQQRVPEGLPPGSVIFSAQTTGPFYADEIDAMWVALERGYKTYNGYSGNNPPSYNLVFGQDCSELSSRMMSWLAFNKMEKDPAAYSKLASTAVPVGFEHCDLSKMPDISFASRAYTAEEFQVLKIDAVEEPPAGNTRQVRVTVSNTGGIPISVRSLLDTEIHIGWRVINPDGTPQTDWDRRKSFPRDIPAHGAVTLHIPVDLPAGPSGTKLAFSLVQERVFWGHDIGMPPFTVPWEKSQ